MGNPLLSSCLTDGLIRWSTSVTRQLALLHSYKYERTLKQLRESTNASFMESSQIGRRFFTTFSSPSSSFSLPLLSENNISPDISWGVLEEIRPGGISPEETLCFLFFI
ncbi:hypothetical protein TNCT_447351 [Trichonephila clavata]|uniref:Uncharacterized protein n=1 Tax=Trichonephila clavata TaxID=2740835 RepID=A0A8X6LYK7_TRICU|nr:hypothetical protein TNCT_447351 [Trichonephila clavata]